MHRYSQGILIGSINDITFMESFDHRLLTFTEFRRTVLNSLSYYSALCNLPVNNGKNSSMLIQFIIKSNSVVIVGYILLTVRSRASNILIFFF